MAARSERNSKQDEMQEVKRYKKQAMTPFKRPHGQG
jgi:hypothetical protein